MFLFFYLSASKLEAPIKPYYTASSSTKKIYDLTNHSTFTINVVKPHSIITIPRKSQFEATAYDSNRNPISNSAEKNHYLFNFGLRTGKVEIKKISRHPILTFRVSIMTDDPSFRELLNKDIKVNQASGTTVIFALGFVFFGFVIIFLLFVCCKKLNKNNNRQPHRDYEEPEPQHRTIIIQTNEVAPQYGSQPQYQQPQQQYAPQAPLQQYQYPLAASEQQYQYNPQHHYPQPMPNSSKNPYDDAY